jgi:hypothetical protein
MSKPERSAQTRTCATSRHLDRAYIIHLLAPIIVDDPKIAGGFEVRAREQVNLWLDRNQRTHRSKESARAQQSTRRPAQRSFVGVSLGGASIGAEAANSEFGDVKITQRILERDPNAEKNFRHVPVLVAKGLLPNAR